ncbi:hypothetical protein H9Q08_11525 [Chryseobacterium sp. PS-8]|uniref:Uncharacterized protein n=1 Tax=Chryseobacterium indicum TaxID=2766954 RepID=A0ABS9C5T7_9FLAO|nr:hypothetical protein [Chryseobacterium sp. PS-8]MCF2219936.1 hypothetical protein [Chryseobacterium sp. PS-8]
MLLLLPLLNSEKLEIHYWFKDNSHTIDAITLNKSQHEIIAILQEIAKELEEEILIEIEPYAEGGFKQIFKVLSKQEKKSATIISAVVLSTITAILITPLTKIAEKTTEHIIDKAFEDKNKVIIDNKKDSLELRKLELQNENIELQNKKLIEQLNQNQIEEANAKIKNVSTRLENNLVIKKRRSNFYEQLSNYDKIDKVSFRIEDKNSNYISEDFIKRKNFNRFILFSDIIEPQIINNAKIEIISPVLKKGYYKWTGIFKNESIPFSMKSVEFKELVQKGDVEFKNGFTISCELQVNKKVDNEGITKITGYEVLRVDNYFVNDKPVETNEGKKHRKLKEAETQMLKLFRYEDDDILPFEF